MARTAAARLAHEDDSLTWQGEAGSSAQVARDLGISPCAPRDGVQAERRRTEPSQGAVTESERAELALVRSGKARWAKEKAELEMERDVHAEGRVRAPAPVRYRAEARLDLLDDKPVGRVLVDAGRLPSPLPGE